jgi:diguanylate cyclase (GGDEF)-like protein
VIWVGGWTADFFALARRLASVAFRLRKRKPLLTGPSPSIFTSTKQGKILQIDQESAARMGETAEYLQNRNWFMWLEKPKRRIVQRWMQHPIPRGGLGLSDCLVRLHGNRWAFWSLWITPIPRGIQISLHDDTERKELGDQLEYALTHDPLTGFLNRWELRRRMERYSRNGQGVLLVMDLDDFKIFNDTRGHDEGDAMLCRVARRLRDHFGVDASLARLGGDEFAIFLPGGNFRKTILRAKKLVAMMARRRSLSGSSAEPSISVALVKVMKGDPPSHVFRAADAALRKAKIKGKSRLEVVRVMMSGVPEGKGSWTLEVSQAMQAGEFEMWLQPVRELNQGRVLFHEALFRLWTPTGLAMPDVVLPAIERLGMRLHLASLVMHRCLEMLKNDRHLVISANIGRELLSDANLASDLVGSFRRAKVHPERLILEISEEAGLEELRAGKGLATRLNEKGFRFAMDDYGRGTASLLEVIELPVFSVKLDPVLWKKAAREPRASWILGKMLSLFKNLKIQVIAEGIAKRSDLKNVRSLGIKAGQGFALGRPIYPEKTMAINPRGRAAGLSLPPSSNLGSWGKKPLHVS